MCQEPHARIHVFALGDVLRDPQHLDRIAVEIEQGIAFGPQPAETAIGPRYPVFDVEVAGAAQAIDRARG
jgi:hypothetical protein